MKKVCLVTFDIKGLISNGGIGTATAALAEQLSSEGLHVDILYANGANDSDALFPIWQAHYLEKGIRLIPVNEPTLGLEGLYHVRHSYAVYLHLKDCDYDFIHFPDMFALGYHTIHAKKLGLRFLNTTLCVTLHGPTQWQLEYNRVFPFYPDELQRYYLERRSVENADVVFGSTDFIFDWVKEKQWKINGQEVKMRLPLSIPSGLSYKGRTTHIDDIVFYGRLETRKGIELFCQSISRIASNLKGKRVRFIGQPGYIGGLPAKDYLKRESAKWKFEFEVVEGLDQETALKELCSTNCLVVIPSLSETLGYTVFECLQLGIPFICSDIPTYREVIPKKLHDQLMFETTVDSLSEAIQDRLTSNFRISTAALPKLKMHEWAKWHKEYRPSATKPLEKIENGPLVSVCMAHRNRPHYLEQALKSLDNQTYKNIEIIIVDDASDTDVSHQYLNLLRNRARTKIIINKQRQGPGLSRNTAAQHAKGEYMLIMDDDNVAKANEIENLISVAFRTNADIVTCPFERFHGAETSAHIASESVWLPYGDDLALSTMYNTMGDMNSLIRTSVFKKLGGLTINAKPGAEDFNFFCRAVISGAKLVVHPDPLFWYRSHNANHSYSASFAESLQLSANSYRDLVPGQDLSALAGLVKAWQMHLYPGTKSAMHVGSLSGGSRNNLNFGNHEYKSTGVNALKLITSRKINKTRNGDWVLVPIKSSTNIEILLQAFESETRYILDFGCEGRFQIALVESYSAKEETLHPIPVNEGRTSFSVKLSATKRKRKIILRISGTPSSEGVFGLRKVYYVRLQNPKQLRSTRATLDQPSL